MLKKLSQITLLLSLAFSLGCKEEADNSYSFFVAGHLYGDPTKDKIDGIHPPFLEKIEFINQVPNIKFGVLTGDVISAPTQQKIKAAQKDLFSLKVPLHIAPGNHEVYRMRDSFEAVFGTTYFAFRESEDLFIVLDPLLDSWNISGNQLDFLQKTVKENQDSTENIFVFFHQLLWWSEDNLFRDKKPNWAKFKADSINFHREIVPLFEKTGLPVYFFAGDYGAYPDRDAVFYHQKNNLKFIASGMGGGTADNFLLIKKVNKKIEIKIIALNGDDIHALGKLEDYSIQKLEEK